MMPPDCCLCHKGIATGHQCELICFRRTAEQEAWHVAAQSRLVPDHPPDCEWFCEDHVDTARALIALNRDQAIAAVRTRETWMLMQIDLFDRDTPPMPEKQGMGLECGLYEFWFGVLATVNVEGSRFPVDYQLRVCGQAPGYSVRRHADDFIRLKRHIETQREQAATVRRIAMVQARDLRHAGVSGADQWLDGLYRHLADRGELSSWLADA